MRLLFFCVFLNKQLKFRTNFKKNVNFLLCILQGLKKYVKMLSKYKRLNFTYIIFW